MLSKKLVLIALSAVLLSACQAIGSGEDSASNINRVRGKRGMTISMPKRANNAANVFPNWKSLPPATHAPV